MCCMDRWFILVEDLRAYDFDGGFVPDYMGRLEDDGWEYVDLGAAVSPHGGLYRSARRFGDCHWKLVDASGMVAHLVCATVQSGFDGADGFRRMFEYAPYVKRMQPDTRGMPSHDRREAPIGPLTVDMVVEFGDMDNDRLDALAAEEHLDPISARRIEFDSRHAAMLADRFMLFTGPYVEDDQLRIVLLVAQRLMFARIVESTLSRAIELSGDGSLMPETYNLDANLRLSYTSLICHPHWRPELETALDDMYATERDYRIACEAVKAVEASCQAHVSKAKRRLAISLDVLTAVVAAATIIQSFAAGGYRTVVCLIAVLLAVIVMAFSFYAHRW